jgi:hypothetical protein
MQLQIGLRKVKTMSDLVDALWFLLDRIFPTVRQLSKAQLADQIRQDQDEVTDRRARIAALPNTPETLRQYLDDSIRLLEEDKDRRQSIDSRLTSIMGLSSIAGTVVFGGIIAQVTGTFHAPSSVFRWEMAFGAFYLTLQLCSAISASVRGLSSRPYWVETSAQVLPSKNEPTLDYYGRRIDWFLDALVDTRNQNNSKLTQMRVAYCAIRNFLVALLLIALLAAGFAVRRQQSSDLIETLQKSYELHEMLRGPQGPVGPTGPRGDPGPPCTQPKPGATVKGKGS